MAADWIKIEHSLPGKPEVMELARILGIDEMCVVGHLVCFWSWVDQNMSPDCPQTKGTKKGLDRVCGRDGFVDAMVQVGWLQFDGENVTIPNYDHHLSESAKKRASEARKKRNQRSRPLSCPAGDGTKTGQHGDKKGDQRREEKSIDREYASQIHDEDIRIPSNVDTPDCRAQMDYYFRALNSQRNDRGEKPIDDFIVQENWNIAGQIGPDRLASVISRAITREWKGLLAIDDAKERATKKQLAGLTEQQHVEWVRITAACRMPGQEGVKARAAFPQETAEIMRMIGGSDAVKSTAPGDFREMELRNRFFATREAQRKLQLEGASA